MTPENDDRRPPQEPDTQPEKSKSTLEALNDTAVGQKASQALKTVTGTAAKVQRNPVIAHLLRAAERFNDRLGNQFGAAITYFVPVDDPDPDGLLCRRRLRAGLAPQPCCRTFSTKFCKTSATQRWRPR